MIFMKTLYCNGTILTMNPDMPEADYLVSEDDRILAVGTGQYAGDYDVCHDLNGHALLPGFMDGHSHLFAMAYSLLTVDLKAAHSIEDVLTKLRQGLPVAKDQWLVGMGYDESTFNGRRDLNRLDLDKISTDIPILCQHASGHVGVVNTKGLTLLGYYPDPPTIPGGVIAIDKSTNLPTGRLEEKALLDEKAQAKMSSIDPERLFAAFKKAQQIYASYGLTTIQDAYTKKDMYEALCYAAKQGLFELDVVSYVDEALFKEQMDQAPRPVYTDHYRIGGAKFFLDGSPQAKTAWLSQPYAVVPEGKPQDYCGFPVATDQEIYTYAYQCITHHWPLHVHCNGDAACEQLIEQYGKALKDSGSQEDLRPVMIHAQTVRDDQLDRMVWMRMGLSFFLDHIYYWGDYHYESVLGPERANHISPARAAKARHLHFTLHQDAPVVMPDTMLAIHNAVNRQTSGGRILGKDQCLTVDQALYALTMDGAYQYHEEKSKGSLEKGKLADLVILSDDPHQVAPDQLKEIQVLETIKEGKTIYRKPG